MKKFVPAVSASLAVPLIILWGGCSADHSAPRSGGNQGAGGNVGNAGNAGSAAGGFGGAILTPPGSADASIGSGGAGMQPGPMSVMIDRTTTIRASLRDVERNPEWRFVREGPMWHGHRVASARELFA